MLESYQGYADENMVMEFLEDYCECNQGVDTKDLFNDFMRDKTEEFLSVSLINDYLDDYGEGRWWEMSDERALNDELKDCSPSELKELFENNDMYMQYFKWDGYDLDTADEDDIISNYGSDTIDWVINEERFEDVDDRLQEFWEEQDDIIEYVNRALYTYEVDE